MVTFSPRPRAAALSDALSIQNDQDAFGLATGSPPQLGMPPASAPDFAVARARDIIETGFMNELRLGNVARRVGLSAGHFCKLFRKVTGVNFVDYVTEVRVEKVKNLLRNPHYRISEAAYEVGFQSISQFNRSFRKVVGASPQSYRTTLILSEANHSL